MPSSPGETIDCLYTVAETADLLRLSTSKVWQLVHSGELESLKIGWSRRVPGSAIDQFIKDGVAAGQAAGGDAA
jgi:excisionase family DNA binding protein